VHKKHLTGWSGHFFYPHCLECG